MFREAGINFKSSPSGLLVPTVTDDPSLGAGVADVEYEMVGPADPTKVLVGTNPPTWATPPGAAPSGAAGGDLSGTYPNPALGTSGVAAGTYGDATHVPQVTFDAKGRATGASSVAIAAGPSGAMTLICSQVLAVSTALLFDTNALLGGNIPTTYNHLIGYFEGRTTADFGSVSVGCTMKINHDAGTNYYRQAYQANDASITASKATEAYVYLGNVPGSAANANMAGSVDFLIQRYQSPFYKRARVRNAYQTAISGTGIHFESEYSVAWQNTAAITRLEIIFGGVPLLAGSSFFLYGVT
jgi:hypothetical protein